MPSLQRILHIDIEYGAHSSADSVLAPMGNHLAGACINRHCHSASHRETPNIHYPATDNCRIARWISFAIFQVNLPFAGGDLADYNAHTERVRQ